MNESRTCADRDTQLTRARSPVVPGSRSARSIPLAEIERRKEEEQETTHEVYFLYYCNRIKIGMSRHAQRRVMMDIAPHCVAPLLIIGTIPGGGIVEARLHARFKEDSDSNEWFHLSPELRDFLCEDRDRAHRLKTAEGRYREWLRREVIEMERNNEGPPDQPGRGARRHVPVASSGSVSCIADLARQGGRLSRRTA